MTTRPGVKSRSSERAVAAGAFTPLAGGGEGLAGNLAFDQAVMEAGLGERALARAWSLAGRAVAIGLAGRAAQELKLGACRADGVEVARRCSGGGSVVLGPEALCLSLYLPAAAAAGLGGARRAQGALGSLMASALGRLGVPGELYPPADVGLGGRKLLGSSLWLSRHGLLYQASLLVEPLAAEAERYLGAAARQPDYRRGRGHAEFMTSLREHGWQEGPGRAAACLTAFLCGAGGRATASESVLRRAAALAAERYARDEWTLKR